MGGSLGPISPPQKHDDSEIEDVSLSFGPEVAEKPHSWVIDCVHLVECSTMNLLCTGSCGRVDFIMYLEMMTQQINNKLCRIWHVSAKLCFMSAAYLQWNEKTQTVVMLSDIFLST